MSGFFGRNFKCTRPAAPGAHEASICVDKSGYFARVGVWDRNAHPSWKNCNFLFPMPQATR